MSNANTEHSRRLRRETAKKYVDKIKSEGGTRITVSLTKSDGEALDTIAEKEGLRGKANAVLFLIKKYRGF